MEVAKQKEFDLNRISINSLLLAGEDGKQRPT